MRWLIELRPTRYKTGHFGLYAKTKPNTTKACIHQSKEKKETNYTTKTQTRAKNIWPNINHTQAAEITPNHPWQRRNGPVYWCMTIFAVSMLQCVMQQNRAFSRCQGGGYGNVQHVYLSLVTLIFDLHIHICPIDGPNTSSLWIWHKSVQRFPEIFDLQTNKKVTDSAKISTLHSSLHAVKTKARFSHLLRHPAWKRRGPILISALHKFVTYLLRHLPTYLQPQDTHRADDVVAVAWTGPYANQCFTGWMLFLTPNQQCQALKAQVIY